jgi:hypothetical protein
MNEGCVGVVFTKESQKFCFYVHMYSFGVTTVQKDAREKENKVLSWYLGICIYLRECRELWQ